MMALADTAPESEQAQTRIQSIDHKRGKHDRDTAVARDTGV